MLTFLTFNCDEYTAHMMVILSLQDIRYLKKRQKGALYFDIS